MRCCVAALLHFVADLFASWFLLQKGAINKQFQSILKIVLKYTSYNNFKKVQYTVYNKIDTIDFRFFFIVPFLESTRDLL